MSNEKEAHALNTIQCGRMFYLECCHRRQVQMNAEILRQVDRVDVMHLKMLDASRTYLGALGVHAVLDFARHHRLIKKLALPRSGVDASCVLELCSILQEGHPSLAEVDLSFNALSTPSVRALWETAKAVPTLTQVKLTGCGVLEEWEERIQRALKVNAEYQLYGFFPYGRARDLTSWRTVFVMVLGGSDQIRHYCVNVLRVLGSYVAPLRLRLAPMTVDDNDNTNRLSSKIDRCADAFNYHMVWCVVFAGPEPLSCAQQTALKFVLARRPPEVDPLRNRLGVMRERIHRCAQGLFVYTEDMGSSGAARTADLLVPMKWLRMTGFIGREYKELCDDVRTMACLLTPMNSAVRCQSDLLASLHTVFAEDPDRPTHVGHLAEDDLMADLIMQPESPLGALHVKPLSVVYQYIENTSSKVNAPLVVYGCADVGKGYLLAHVACTLNSRKEAVENSAVGMQHWRVVHYAVDINSSSVVVFLYRLLSVFAPASTLNFHSLSSLTLAVSESVAKYDGPPIVVLASRIDAIDMCGYSHCVATGWLPHVLPANVKIVVSLKTDSHLLPSLRKRVPQPYECLVPPLPDGQRVLIFKGALGMLNVSLPGLEARPISSGKGLNDAEAVLAAKEGSSAILYVRLAALYIKCVHSTHTTAQSEYDTVDLLAGKLPDRLEDLIIALCQEVESINSRVAVSYVMLCLVAAPLSIPDIVYVCEELGPCAPYTTLPALLHLSDVGLVSWYSDSTAYIRHSAVAAAVTKAYAEKHDEVSVLVENHLYRQVMTHSAEMFAAFRHLVRLMVSNGNFQLAIQLVLNTTVMDAVLTAEGQESRVVVIDAFFRLLLARDMLVDMAASGEPFGVSIPEEPLRRALNAVQQHRANLFQTSLLRCTTSPYHDDARKRMERPPYPIIVPQNDGAEDSSAATISGGSVCLHCHSRGEYVVVTTMDSVVLHSLTSGQEVDRLPMPFERNQKMIGSLMATGTRVVVIGEDQVLIWNFVGKSFFHSCDISVTASPTSLDSFGTTLIVKQKQTHRLCLLDVTKKRIVCELPVPDSPLSFALFGGNSVLAVVHHKLYLLDKGMSDSIQMAHDGPISNVSCNLDGRIIASCVDTVLWLWSSRGELLHRIEAGNSPLISLRFNSAGTFLITQQPEGVKMWKAVTGMYLATLASPMECESVCTVCYTEDNRKIIGHAGNRLLIWDAQTFDLIGSLAAPQGRFVSIFEQGNNLCAATNACGTKVWCLGSTYPSSVIAHRDTLTTNWHRNAKVSHNAIDCASVNSNATHIAITDATGAVSLFDIKSGDRMEHQMPSGLHDLIALGTDTIAAVSPGRAAIALYHASHHSLSWHNLPKEATDDAELHLFKSEDEKILAVTYLRRGHSIMYVYEMPNMRFVLHGIGHAGRILAVFFVGDFALSVGEDRVVRLWNLTRQVERASYVHPHDILVITCAQTGTFLLVDTSGRGYRLYVDPLASTSPVFELQREKAIEAAAIGYSLDCVRAMTWMPQGLVFVIITDGTVVVVDLFTGRKTSHIMLSGCTMVRACIIESDVRLLTGHTDGSVYIHRLIIPESHR